MILLRLKLDWNICLVKISEVGLMAILVLEGKRSNIRIVHAFCITFSIEWWYNFKSRWKNKAIFIIARKTVNYFSFKLSARCFRLFYYILLILLFLWLFLKLATKIYRMFNSIKITRKFFSTATEAVIKLVCLPKHLEKARLFQIARRLCALGNESHPGWPFKAFQRISHHEITRNQLWYIIQSEED